MADHIDTTGDSGAVTNQVAQRARLENPVAASVDCAQPLVYVAVAFGPLKWIEYRLRTDALFELAERRVGQPA